MNRFWKSIILPLFNEIKPKYIVEIGSEYGINTKNILKYCYANKSKLISIDPLPQFNFKELEKMYGQQFKLYENLSLDCLNKLEKYDLILIDGDHNWYTVYNELKVIENSFKEDEFPIILLHDISWPYGKRDCYYNPDTIPPEFLHPYEKKGIKPDKIELDDDGINKTLNNAKYEKTPKNGVLTAINDFLNETDYDLAFFSIKLLNGLGIICRNTTKNSKIIEKIINHSNIMHISEKYYYNKIIEINTHRKQLQEKNQILNNNNNQLTETTKQLTETTKQLQEKNQILNNNNNQLTETTKQLQEKNQILNNNNNQLTETTKQLKINNETLTNIKKLNETHIELLKEELKLKESQINELNIKNNNYIQRNSLLSSTKRELSTEIKTKNNNLIQLKNKNQNLLKRNIILTKTKNELKYDLEEMKKRNILLTETKKQLDQKIIKQNKIIENLKNKEEELSKRNEKISKSNKQILYETKLLKNENKNLNNENNQIKKEQNKNLKIIKEYENSNSWKITSPMRKIMNYFRK